MKTINSNTIRKITGKAPLKLSVNNTFIGFTVLGNKYSPVKKLIAQGYEAENIGYGFIKVSNVKFENIY